MTPPVTEASILAGGFGTRLASAVPDLPKPLALVAGRSFLAWLLDSLDDSGLTRIILATGHRAAMIEAAIGQRRGPLHFAYSHEPTPLGTGGALFQALTLRQPARVFALHGNTFQRLDLPALAAIAPWADITMAVRSVPDRTRFGAVEIADGHITRFGEKGVAGAGLVNAGRYLLQRDLPARLGLPARFSIESDVLEAMTVILRIAAHVADGPFLDIGTPEDWRAAETLLPDWTQA